MEINNSVRDILREYDELFHELKEKEKLYDLKVIQSDELEVEFDNKKKELDEVSKKLHEKQADVYGKKHGYVYKCEKRRFWSVMGLGCIIPFVLNIFPGINGALNLNGINLLFNTIPFGFGLACLDTLFLGKKNTRRYYRNYPKSKEGKFYNEELNQIKELEKLHEDKLNAYNDCVLRIHQNKNEVDALRKECRDIQYRMSRINSDYFRLMYDEYLLEEQIEDKPFELKRK